MRGSGVRKPKKNRVRRIEAGPANKTARGVCDDPKAVRENARGWASEEPKRRRPHTGVGVGAFDVSYIETKRCPDIERDRGISRPPSNVGQCRTPNKSAVHVTRSGDARHAASGVLDAGECERQGPRDTQSCQNGRIGLEPERCPASLPGIRVRGTDHRATRSAPDRTLAIRRAPRNDAPGPKGGSSKHNPRWSGHGHAGKSPGRSMDHWRPEKPMSCVAPTPEPRPHA